MKVMFIVFHDLQSEARSQEILECSTKIGESTVVSYTEPIDKNRYNYVVTGNGRKNYPAFLFDAMKELKKSNPDVIILHDNYTAPLLWYIKLFHKNAYIIYDSSELYIEKKKITSVKMLYSEMIRWSEKLNIQKVDTLIAANIERAKIMEDYFGLQETPLVFDNIHKIDDDYDEIECVEKYNEYIKSNTFSIVYAGGIAKGRLTYDLALALKELGNNYSLIVVGSATSADVEDFKNLLRLENISNVTYLGFIPRNEWRFLLKKSNISVSIFAQDTLNNINCASGKLYESLFERVPVLTSTNPPFKRLCDTYGIGVSTYDFVRGIKQLEENYEYYSKNIDDYLLTINYDTRINDLASKINKRIEERGLIK